MTQSPPTSSDSQRLQVLFAPDWRRGAPYQAELARALAGEEVDVSFLAHYKRALPLSRLVREWRQKHRCDWLHLHWPEAYFPQKKDGRDWLRFLRFPLDLWLARRGGLPLAVTAHNLQAHNRRDPFAFRNTRTSFRQARVIFCHSATALETIRRRYGISERKIAQIENGDTAASLGPARPRNEAREELKLGHAKVCLMFGAVEPYKGMEEAIDYWRKAQPECQLHIAGKPRDAEYAQHIRDRAAGVPGVTLHLGWLSDEQLVTWLSAADCTLFNYRSIFNSGSAPTARSYGVPILLPHRLDTVELGEPDLSVIRFQDFESDFSLRLHQALAQPADYALGAPWRARTSWKGVAQVTAQAFRTR